MDNKHPHIEEWLKKAAQQPAPDAGQELKQQSWAGMAAMLDKEQGAGTQPASRRLLRWFLPRHAALLIPLGAAACAFTTWLIWQASNHTAQPAPADTATVFAGPAATPVPPGAPASAGEQDTPLARQPASAGNTGAGTILDNILNNMPALLPPPAATNGAQQQAPGLTRLPDTAAMPAIAGRPAFHPSARGSMPLPLSAGTGIKAGAGYDNELVIPSPAGRLREQDGLPAGKAPGRAVTNNNRLHALPTINLYALQVPALSADSHRRQRLLPPAPVQAGKKESPRRWAAQAGLLYPFGGAYGINAGLLYAFPLGTGWSLQPEINAGFITGYSKRFDHQAVRNTRVDTIGSNISLYRKDTVATPYTLQRAFMGAAGIHLAYTARRVTLRTGLAYSYALASGRKDSAVISNGAITVDSTQQQTEFSTPAFHTGQLPGIHQLSWSVDAAYRLSPRIHAGIRYRAALIKSGGNSGFKGPAKAVQDNSLLELYLRMPLGR